VLFRSIKTEMYYVYLKIGDIITGPPFVMTPKEYQDFMMMQASRDYYRDKSDRYSLMFRKDVDEARRQGILPTLSVRNKIFESIFGGNKIEIIPSGFSSVVLVVPYHNIDNIFILSQNRITFAFNI